MYRVITTHIEQVLDAIHIERDVQSYIWLKEQFKTVDASADARFQKRYRQYWQLNPARLSDRFLQSYFGLLEQLRDTNDITVETVAQRLHETPSHGNDRRSLQFSFSTKLVHMLRPHAPIYDSTVEAFYFLPTSTPSEPTDQKLRRLSVAYGFLTREYQRVLREHLLAPSIAAFHERFDPAHIFTNEKIVDTLIWRFVTLLRRGAIADARVIYA